MKVNKLTLMYKVFVKKTYEFCWDNSKRKTCEFGWELGMEGVLASSDKDCSICDMDVSNF